MKNLKQVYIVDGDRNTGKTVFVLKLIELLKKTNLKFSGVLAPSVINHSGTKNYDLLFLDTEALLPFASKEAKNDWQQYRHFYFNPLAVQAGNTLLQHCASNQFDLVIIDEIGIFELEGLLWADSLTLLLQSTNSLLLTVRTKLIEKVINHWNIQNVEIVDKKTIILDLLCQKLHANFQQ